MIQKVVLQVRESMRRKVIITIAIGEVSRQRWQTYCEANWQKYTNKYGYDLICHSSALDVSERAQKRSPAWQKCLILTDEVCKKYERVVWMDADILINYKGAPDIAEQVPLEKIGGINALFFCRDGLLASLHRQYLELWKRLQMSFIEDRTGQDYYKNYGISTDLSEVMQTGVLILSPKHHKNLLEKVYYGYEAREGAMWKYSYEMRALSYEIINSRQYCFIDGRFNYLFHHYLAAFHSGLFFRMMGLAEATSGGRRFLRRLRDHFELKQAMKSAFSKSFFLHFAGCPKQQFLWQRSLRLTRI